MRIEHLPELDSTNAEIRRRALAGEAGPLWIQADVQTAGRGRRGRSWTSAPGNLFCTGLYTLDVSAAQAAQLSFAAALAVAELAASAVDPGLVTVKWPNDVLVGGIKVAGILLESGARPEGGLWLAVGIGINLAHHPADTERPATNLALHGSRLQPREAASRLAGGFDLWRQRWQANGFTPIRDAWLARAHGLGELCEVRLDGETLSGRFADLMPDGTMRLDLVDGQRRYISAGDVFFPSTR